jgi:hypothetical protein
MGYRGAYGVLVGKHDGKIPPGRLGVELSINSKSIVNKSVRSECTAFVRSGIAKSRLF